MVAARQRLVGARGVLDDDPSTALSAAYYAMLYAARAALSERDTAARTHRGTWYEFRRAFVETGLVDAELAKSVQAVQPEREQADYEAWFPSGDDARQVIELAASFLAVIDELLG